MNIAFFEIQDWEREVLQKELKGHYLQFYEKPLTLDNVERVKNCEIISVFIYSKIGTEILSKLPNVKLITTRSMGLDHIDLKTCNRRKILVCNAPHYGDNSVAEHTFGLILSISRNIHKAYVRTIKKDYTVEGLKGFDIKGKTLGVLGTGRIGMTVVKIARAFDMNVLAVDAHPDKKMSKKLGFEYTDLNNLLRKSDIISIHFPYTPENHHLIDIHAFQKMKKGAILINTARGAIVDTTSMLYALKTGQLASVGLDVLEGEELIKEEKELLHEPLKLNMQKMQQVIIDHELLENENVVFTPHIAFYSQEAVMRIIETTIENICAFINKKPINIIK